MQVTAILPAPRKPGRFEILIDGRPAALLSIEAVERLHLETGGVLDERQREHIERESSILATYDRAIGMLALRARSSTELRRQLLRKGEPAEYVDVAIVKLQDAGYLDDAAFARQFARAKVLGTGMSKRRLAQELGKRGVSSAVSSEAIGDVFEEERIDEEQNLERVARKKLRSLAKLDPAVQRRRLFAFLARRGYDVDDIAHVVRVMTNG